ncbi:nucleotidyltransferase [Carnobacterium gallinarum]|uniref:nucleotidyltransferase n=1 Tax=Carnobacterium gallinarum TaxID=2749 RepID=UPI00055515E6|nr:nucleotidyltransferase [Carnobacterium gallinarum]
MKSCGVIVEYNPFHNGHLYHLQEAKKLAQADVMIAVMSGNFLQRGEPALVDKWTRAEMALAAGVDLVVELPVYYSVQAADYFAAGGVALLQALGCDSLCFGAESGTGSTFSEAANWFLTQQETFDQAFQQVKNQGLSYAKQMQEVLTTLNPKLELDLTAPNNTLGLSYAKANLNYARPMELYAVKRQQAGYHDAEIHDNYFASATAIRKKLIEDADLNRLSGVLPSESLHLLQNEVYLTWEDYWPLLRYQIIVSSLSELREIYQMNEGIEFRLKEKVKEAKNFNEFVSLVKNKRYTWVRLQRLCVAILLQFKKNQILELLEQPKGIRILGFNQQGSRYLKAKKKQIQLPVVTNITSKNQELFELDIEAGLIYQMGNSHVQPQDFKRKPLIYIGK